MGQSEDKREVVELKSTFSDIIDLYGRRLKLMERRKNLLQNFLSNHGDYIRMDSAHNTKVISELKQICAKERNMLNFITHPKSMFDRVSRIAFFIKTCDT